MSDNTAIFACIAAIAFAFIATICFYNYEVNQSCPSRLELVEGQLKNCEASTEFLAKNCECVK
jgi:hypothetical protein